MKGLYLKAQVSMLKGKGTTLFMPNLSLCLFKKKQTSVADVDGTCFAPVFARQKRTVEVSRVNRR